MLTPDGCTDEGRMERRKLYTPQHTSYAGGIKSRKTLNELTS